MLGLILWVPSVGILERRYATWDKHSDFSRSSVRCPDGRETVSELCSYSDEVDGDRIFYLSPVSRVLLPYPVYSLTSVWFNACLTFLVDNAVSHLPSDLIPPGACNLLNPSTIYANNEVCLSEVDIYGFDYDYTLALYSNALNTMIFNTARTFLIEHYKVRQHGHGVGVDALVDIKSIFSSFLPPDSTPKASPNTIIFQTLLFEVFIMTSRR